MSPAGWLLDRAFALSGTVPPEWLRYATFAMLGGIALLAGLLQANYVPNDFAGYQELMIEIQSTGVPGRGKELVALIFLTLEEVLPHWWLGNASYLIGTWLIIRRAAHLEYVFLYAFLLFR